MAMMRPNFMAALLQDDNTETDTGNDAYSSGSSLALGSDALQRYKDSHMGITADAQHERRQNKDRRSFANVNKSAKSESVLNADRAQRDANVAAEQAERAAQYENDQINNSSNEKIARDRVQSLTAMERVKGIVAAAKKSASVSDDEIVADLVNRAKGCSYSSGADVEELIDQAESSVDDDFEMG